MSDDLTACPGKCRLEKKITLMMLLAFRRLLSKFIHGARCSEEFGEELILQGWLRCEMCRENTGKCDYSYDIRCLCLYHEENLRIFIGISSNEVKPDKTPNVNLPKIGVSRDLPLEELFHLLVFYTWD